MQGDPEEAQEKPRRSPGVAQNSPDANLKPEEVPKSMRVRMCARSITTKPVHTATNSRQEKVPKRLRVRTRARWIADDQRQVLVTLLIRV